MINKRMIAGILAEKAKQQQAPFLNNPMAKPANTMQVNPIGVPSPAGGPSMPMAPAAPGVPTPGFSPSRFGNLKSKLRI